MSQINQSQITINGNLVAHIQRMAVEMAEFVVDVHVEAIAADHTDLTETHCRDCRMRSGTTAGGKQPVAVEDHADVIGYGIGTDQDDMFFRMLFS